MSTDCTWSPLVERDRRGLAASLGLAARAAARCAGRLRSAGIDGEQQVVGRLAAAGLQVAARAFGEVDDLVVGVDDDRGGAEPLDQLQVQLAPRADPERSAARPDRLGRARTPARARSRPDVALAAGRARAPACLRRPIGTAGDARARPAAR